MAVGGVHGAHLHGLVFRLRGGADEPAAVLHGLKLVHRNPRLPPEEQEARHVLVVIDLPQILLRALLADKQGSVDSGRVRNDRCVVLVVTSRFSTTVSSIMVQERCRFLATDRRIVSVSP